MGKGAGAGAHSHDDEYPDDNWNLYQHIERAEVLNAADGSDATKVLRPFVRRLDTDGSLVSDGDEELLVKLTFVSPVSLRRLMVIGSGDPDTHPARVKVYIGKEDLDFQSLEDTRPNFETALPLNQPGEAFVHVHPPGAFTNVTSLACFFPANHGNGDETSLQYLGLQGDHSHDKREAVDATYELVCQHSSVDVAAETRGAMGL